VDAIAVPNRSDCKDWKLSTFENQRGSNGGILISLPEIVHVMTRPPPLSFLCILILYHHTDSSSSLTSSGAMDFPTTVPISTLFLILDIHPLSWSLLATQPPALEHPTPLINKAPTTALSLSEFVTSLMVFLNAHVASRWGNEVVVYAATAGRA
jgi:hypothetical protein